MAQIKIFARRATIERHRAALSDAIHKAVMQALAYPAEKRFHRFIGLEAEDFVHPADRSENYLIIEISLFEGRSAEAKKALIRGIFANVTEATGIAPQDVEITIFETPRGNWGIRGVPGDELALGYVVSV
ncbi:MAG TPA: tautomerase family protein [Geminicoccaceae bacterium]|nr:tautomerase family protein [Geminicoccus sp.]HMU53302.1 tautomerase family protein [Geminicoccaceae bacterium]